MRARAHGVHATMAVVPNRLIFAASVERRVEEGIFWTRHANMMTKKNDGTQPPADVHDPSFSLRDED
jgi:hypothetical protein